MKFNVTSTCDRYTMLKRDMALRESGSPTAPLSPSKFLLASAEASPQFQTTIEPSIFTNLLRV